MFVIIIIIAAVSVPAVHPRVRAVYVAGLKLAGRGFLTFGKAYARMRWGYYAEMLHDDDARYASWLEHNALLAEWDDRGTTGAQC